MSKTSLAMAASTTGSRPQLCHLSCKTLVRYLGAGAGDLPLPAQLVELAAATQVGDELDRLHSFAAQDFSDPVVHGPEFHRRLLVAGLHIRRQVFKGSLHPLRLGLGVQLVIPRVGLGMVYLSYQFAGFPPTFSVTSRQLQAAPKLRTLQQHSGLHSMST